MPTNVQLDTVALALFYIPHHFLLFLKDEPLLFNEHAYGVELGCCAFTFGIEEFSLL